MTTYFKNEPRLDLRSRGERESLTTALSHLDERLPLRVPVIIGGDPRFSSSFHSIDPGEPSRAVADVSAASVEDVESAVELAGRAQPAWARQPAHERAAALSRAAAELRGLRRELAALQVREAAKPWDQADADVCEAIDFLEYYAAQAILLDRGRELMQLPGERNTMVYRARGVTAVIAPWNFPMAIATGMTAAALVTGNSVCLKPAEQTPACAQAIVAALHRAGVPAGALALLPGGAEIGAALVAHNGVHTIAFTGSEAVGREILGVAAEIPDGQLHMKRVVAEMGGKNCVIVDYDADLDDVVPAAIDSAFAFAGQKCSAASRLLVHERVFDVLRRRLYGALETLTVGQAEQFSSDVPPVIDAEARIRIERAVFDAGTGVSLRRVIDVPSGEGFWVAPTVIVGAPIDSEIVRSELFGPVLSLEPFDTIAAACDVVESQRQALTGALFSRNPKTIAEVVARTPVGNLYVNRGTTGAMVARQPFGGNRMSGTGAKAGGPDYLLSFVEPLVVSENTTRHGLSI